MGRKKFLTTVRTNSEPHADYVLKGLLAAYRAIGKNCEKGYFHIATDKNNNTLLFIECTNAQYRRFSKVIEGVYPGLCDFDL